MRNFLEKYVTKASAKKSEIRIERKAKSLKKVTYIVVALGRNLPMLCAAVRVFELLTNQCHAVILWPIWNADCRGARVGRRITFMQGGVVPAFTRLKRRSRTCVPATTVLYSHQEIHPTYPLSFLFAKFGGEC